MAGYILAAVTRQRVFCNWGLARSLKPKLLDTYFHQLDPTISQIGLWVGATPQTYESVGAFHTETMMEERKRDTFVGEHHS